jgi:hypothetical protein
MEHHLQENQDRLSAHSTPASPHSTGDDRQNGSAGGGSYHLADDGNVVDPPQGWDEHL